MKQAKIDLSTTIEQLENNTWGSVSDDVSSLVRRTFELRRKKLSELVIEDLRLLINQNIALSHTIPLALRALKEDIMSEGDFYEGDLLHAVLTVEDRYWLENREEADIVKQLYIENRELIEEFDTTEEIKSALKAAFDKLSQKVK